MRKPVAAIAIALALATGAYLALTERAGDGTRAAAPAVPTGARAHTPPGVVVPKPRHQAPRHIDPNVPGGAKHVAAPVRRAGHAGSFAPSDRARVASAGAPPGITLAVPRLGIQAPVHEGKPHDGILPIAPGYSATHYFDSAGLGQPGNYVVYGHDDIDGKIFEYLGSLRAGDLVYFHRGTRRYTYVVTGQQIVAPSDVAVLDPTPNATLTMISCTPLWVDSQRIVIRGVFVGVDG